MNVLLFLPGFLLCLAKSEGFFRMILHVLSIIFTQVIIGFPFLSFNWQTYIGKAFEFDWQFFFKWSVNWKFLGEELALNPTFAKVLLCSHIVLLVFFLFAKWIKIKNIFRELRVFPLFDSKQVNLDPEFIVRCLFICNFLGILCARSLHY
jgi:alpha-1,3-mannosyltransferase